MKLTDKRSDQIGLAIIISLSALVIFLLASTFNWFNNDQYPAEITISGEGRAFAVPDTAVFTYSVTSQGADAAEAQQGITRSLQGIKEALLAAGVTETDIKTQSYNVYPRYEYRTVAARPAGAEIMVEPGFPGGVDQTQVLVGYEASQTDQVRVRKTDDAGSLLTLVTDNGADNLSSLDFVVWDESEIESEARDLAIADAKQKALELATQLGVDLGKITSFYENEDGSYPQPYAMDAKLGFSEAQESAPAEISLGENEIRKTVNITYRIN